MEDGYTVFLSATLIFVVLFFIYPLKFMAQIIINTMILKNGFGVEFDVGYVGIVDVSHLFLVYGIGGFFIWFILGLMYLHAYNKREVLELDNNELLITTNSIVANFGHKFTDQLKLENNFRLANSFLEYDTVDDKTDPRQDDEEQDQSEFSFSTVLKYKPSEIEVGPTHFLGKP